ncbi:Ca2+-binding EF-hand protein [Perkinsela sp. CCAP 1560/4]|nr:Ca2+-binding EF-hand protein [Perkinsela sp. CCAP 1560/4]|eukprot:KNH05760.1 Ca2+-binding EF-hand protein [Perkinsela sp. CCAP 1560/4]
MASLTHDQVHEAFQLFDSDGKGLIDAEEMFYAMKGLGFDEMTKEQVENIISELCDNATDATKSNGRKVNAEQFKQVVFARMAPKDSPEEMQKAFRLFDVDQTGKITEKNLRAVAEMLGETPSEETLRDMIKAADLDGDGVVSLSDFQAVMEQMRGK